MTTRKRSMETDVPSSMDALRTGTIATNGARLTYQQVNEAGEPREPLPEIFRPEIHFGVCNTEVMVDPFDEGPPAMRPVHVVRSENPKQAYQLIGKPSISLDHHGQGWGEINVAVQLPRKYVAGGQVVFTAPDPSEAKLVAIKKLDKMVVRHYLARGGHEDPYKEISRMQQFGDGVHVLECIEALEDDRFLYIVMPYCHEGSLMDNLPWNRGYPEADAKAFFKNILEILLYLEKNGIFHHDLSPDNFLIFEGRLVLFDFAMSIRIPREENGQRYLMPPQGVFGTMPCQAPELYLNKWPSDGVFADLWAAATILYSLLTGHVLYRHPHPTDILFRYYIMAEGLQPGLNEGMVEILEAAFQPENNEDQANLMAHAMANLNIPPDALEVLINLLKLDPTDRWTLMQTVESTWVQSG